MSQTETVENTITVETIGEADLWQAVCEGINELSWEEAAFEFYPDRFKVVSKDPANIALIRQVIDADAFDHYDVEGEFVQGINTSRFEDLLKKSGADDVSFGYNWSEWRWGFEGGGVDAFLGGIDVESVNGSPAEVPPIKDDLPYDVDVTLPVDRFERASDVVDMATEIAEFRMGGPDGIFIIAGKGDTDDYTIRIHDHDDFAWNEDPPEDVVTTRQSNKYIEEVVDLIDEDTVRVVTGDDLPYHLWTEREDGRIDTKILQAPRIVNE